MTVAFEIDGGKPLHGLVKVGGAKNSALKLLPAALLAPGRHVISNVPDVSDIATMVEVLRSMGVDTKTEGSVFTLDVPDEIDPVAPYDLTSRMRASIQILGPLLARCGRAQVAMPGGCNLGSRKLDMHLQALEEMGVEFSTSHGDLVAEAPKLKGGRIVLEFPSVGATENVLLTAMGTDAEIELDNAAREPELADLCEMLVAMGAEIEGVGTPTIRMRGTTTPKPVRQTVVGDRIEAGTYLVAGAITDGQVTVEGVDPLNLELFLQKLAQIGVEIDIGTNWVTASRSDSGLRAADVITLPFPGFPTDLQPQTAALLTFAQGTSVITENIFDGRYQYVNELERMGADIRTDGRHAIVTGPTALQGAPVAAPDIRAGAALVCAALAAPGHSSIANVELIDRGYEHLVAKVQGLGGAIERRM